MSLKASVIVRSYNRLPALLELLEILRNQKNDNFEIVIVDQSTEFVDEDWDKLTGISQEDERVKLLKYEPLGGPKARNEGVIHSSGDILIFVDDDDLPYSNNWVSEHVGAYKKDEYLVGFTGRHIFEGNKKCPYISWMRWFIRKKCMSYNWLKFPYTFAQFDENVGDVEWLHGTNSSIRKEWAVKAGLWDTHVRNQDEHSFAFKLQPLLGERYHLDFKKEPALVRRMDIEGGMDKRKFSFKMEFINQFQYLSKTLYVYRPRLLILFPFQITYIFLKSIKKMF